VERRKEREKRRGVIEAIWRNREKPITGFSTGRRLVGEKTGTG